MIVLYLFIWLIVSCLFGLATIRINESKGYYGGFWWGFFLGWLGVIVILCKHDNTRSYYRESEADRALSSYAAEKSPQRLVREDDWRCPECKRINASYVTTCICGTPKNYKKEKVQNASNEKLKSAPHEKLQNASKADEIGKFKKLLDEGAITQEEYDRMKSRILQ